MNLTSVLAQVTVNSYGLSEVEYRAICGVCNAFVATLQALGPHHVHRFDGPLTKSKLPDGWTATFVYKDRDDLAELYLHIQETLHNFRSPSSHVCIDQHVNVSYVRGYGGEA
jgi:hypothetical protein